MICSLHAGPLNQLWPCPENDQNFHDRSFILRAFHPVVKWLKKFDCISIYVTVYYFRYSESEYYRFAGDYVSMGLNFYY